MEILNIFTRHPGDDQGKAIRFTLTEDFDISLIGERYKATELRLCHATQKQFDTIINRYGDRFEYIELFKCPRISDLSALETLENLKYVFISWNQKAERLWDFRKNTNLSEVLLSDFTRLYNLQDLEMATELRGLQISGGMWKNWKIESFEPLANMVKLEELRILRVLPDNLGFEPLYKMNWLEQLDISTNLFPVEEYAKLAAKLKNTYCEAFKGYVKVSKSDDWVQLVGKRKPELFFADSGPRILRYSEEFLEKVKEYVNSET